MFSSMSNIYIKLGIVLRISATGRSTFYFNILFIPYFISGIVDSLINSFHFSYYSYCIYSLSIIDHSFNSVKYSLYHIFTLKIIKYKYKYN